MSKGIKFIKDLDPQMDQILNNDLNNRLNKFIEFIDLYSDNELEKTLSLICKELSKREVNNE
tara:strand:- start:527 stop:712 length:186 start_codon:yes stop_codon:yes gene_type:complete